MTIEEIKLAIKDLEYDIADKQRELESLGAKLEEKEGQ